jgi:dTDP-4-amino-4,6-dideoxygalactose transaminase
MIEGGIGVSVYYDPPVHLTPYYKQFSFEGSLTNTESASKTVLSFPVHPYVTETDVEKMVNILKEELPIFV